LLSTSFEDGIPEILAELSRGHEVAGMRGLYSHVSEQMRQELKDTLQARWERSLLNPAPVATSVLTGSAGQRLFFS
jgi:hypothetical protein